MKARHSLPSQLLRSVILLIWYGHSSVGLEAMGTGQQTASVSSMHTTPSMLPQDDHRPAAADRPGHLKPLGSHRPPEQPGIDVLDEVPDSQEFFTRYVRKGRPAVFRGAAKNMASYQLWTDEYLSEKYGDLVVEVEEGKKENRSKSLWHMPLSQFIRNYQQADQYLVTDVPPEMADEVCLLRCMRCGGFTRTMVDPVLWYSSGGTKSVLHYDSLDNINCIMDGSKEVFLVDKREKASVDIDHLDGMFSGVDVERVDFTKYPGLDGVPWYNVTLEKGDCLFIPYKWFHSVRSAAGRNLAVNVWVAHRLWFNASDCHGDQALLPEYLLLSSIKTRADSSEMVRAEMANEIDERGEALSLDNLLSMDFLASQQQEGIKLFELLDADHDQEISLQEVYTESFFQACHTANVQFGEEEEEEEEEEESEDDGEIKGDEDSDNVLHTFDIGTREKADKDITDTNDIRDEL